MPITSLQRDPLTHGRSVLDQKCLTCHRYGGQGPLDLQMASDLMGVGTRTWVRGLLENPRDPKYFGAAPKLKGMKTWKAKSKLDARQLDLVADFVAGLAEVQEGETFDEWNGSGVYDCKLKDFPGQPLFVAEWGSCHVLGEEARSPRAAT